VVVVVGSEVAMVTARNGPEPENNLDSALSPRIGIINVFTIYLKAQLAQRLIVCHVTR
jgi:hypothetical protein